MFGFYFSTLIFSYYYHTFMLYLPHVKHLTFYNTNSNGDHDDADGDDVCDDGDDVDDNDGC